MKCPNCGTTLLREDGIEVVTGRGESLKEVPVAQYWCEVCGLEAKWVLGQGLTEIWNPKKELTEEYKPEQ